MKRLFPFIKIFVIYVALLALIGFVTGFLSTKPQLQENSIRWSASLSEGDQAQIMDTRDYGQYYFILGRYDVLLDTEGASSSSISVHNEEALLVTKEEWSAIMWEDGQYVWLITGDISPDEITQVAAGISFTRDST